MTDDRVIPIEQEIHNLQREIDNAEWEGRPSNGLQKELNYLVEELNKGELWYPMF